VAAFSQGQTSLACESAGRNKDSNPNTIAMDARLHKQEEVPAIYETY
jgi:hypothetical protein